MGPKPLIVSHASTMTRVCLRVRTRQRRPEEREQSPELGVDVTVHRSVDCVTGGIGDPVMPRPDSRLRPTSSVPGIPTDSTVRHDQEQRRRVERRHGHGYLVFFSYSRKEDGPSDRGGGRASV